jgi:hypothetical protein
MSAPKADLAKVEANPSKGRRMSDALETIYSSDRKRRIVIYKRDDGLFAYREEYHWINDYDKDRPFEGWAKLPPGRSYFASLDVARREVIARVGWPVDNG